MIKFGLILILIAALLWFYIPISSFFTNIAPNEGIIFAAIAIFVIGSLLILIGVAIDRFKEHEEEKKNDDYRKY